MQEFYPHTCPSQYPIYRPEHLPFLLFLGHRCREDFPASEVLLRPQRLLPKENNPAHLIHCSKTAIWLPEKILHIHPCASCVQLFSPAAPCTHALHIAD